MAVYESFPIPLRFGDLKLRDLEWRETTPNGMDGRSWRVREKSGSHCSVHVKVSGSVCGTMGLGGGGEDITAEIIRPVLAEAIQRSVAERGEPPSLGEELVIWIEPDDFRIIGMEPPP